MGWKDDGRRGKESVRNTKFWSIDCTEVKKPVTATAAVLILWTAPLAAEDVREWSADLVRDPRAWAPDPSVTVSDEGVRVTIRTGGTWRMAAANGIRLPERVGEIRARVTARGGKGRWLLRVYGDLRGDGRPRTVGFFGEEEPVGDIRRPVDPRLVGPNPRRQPFQVQVGLEGAPGDSVLFESLEFVPAAPLPARTPQPGQIDIASVDLMPDVPRPFAVKDWRALARAYDAFVFDLDARGEYLPLIWIDDSRVNIDRPAFGLPSYAGDNARRSGPNHEGITCMGAVLSATLAGVDKRKGPHDWVLMCEAYHNTRNGENLVLNGVSGGAGGSFWYEIWPHVVFYALADRYPGAGRMEGIVRTTADRWADACTALRGKDGVPDFDHTSFSFREMKPVDNGKWKEPDAAAGVAWLEYTAWSRFRDEKHLRAAEGCLRFLEARRENPYYEILLPWGALTAARWNAERGATFDVGKLVDWCFGISECRGGWGVIVNRWDGYDCHGLVGSVDDRGGYAFAMNTFAQAGALVPLVRYDPRYARAIGKWMLNLASAARLFYSGELPPGHESTPWKADAGNVVAYEGLRHAWRGKSPYATGDPVAMKWGPPTDRGLYGSGYVGILGGIVARTDVEEILRLDCLATDFHRAPAYPTYLYYNPHPAPRAVGIDAGDSPRDLYDACAGRFVARGARGIARVELPAGGAALIVLAPAGGKETREGGRTLVDGVVIDFRH